MHRRSQPAIEVFSKGNRLFPALIRMLLGLGSACTPRFVRPGGPTFLRSIGPKIPLTRLLPVYESIADCETIPSERLVETLETVS